MPTPKKATGPRFCRFCGCDISAMRSDATVCWDKKCRNAFGREKEQFRLYPKTCKQCGVAFQGRRQQSNCPDCEGKRTVNHEVIQQELRCYRCDAPMGYRARKVVPGVTQLVAKPRLCESCQQAINESRAEHKRGDRNPNWKGGIIIPRMTKEEMKAKSSERMRANNPMKNPSVVDRVKQSIREAALRGEICHKTGQEHHLWRGNREPSFVIRTRLKPWIRSVMERDDFTCQSCGVRGGRLEVHHLHSFRSICAAALTEFQVESLKELNVNSVLFENITQAIIAAHTLDVGITYCKTCHARHDERRRIGSHEN